MDERVIVTLAEFRDNLRNTAGREVRRQAGDDPFLDTFS
jgi:hypothetical protein